MKVEAQDPSRKKTAKSPAPRKRRWPRRLFSFVLFLGIVGYFLPQLAAYAIPNRQALAFLTSRLPANFEVDHAELAWQSPVRFGGITVSAPDGQSVATVENVSSQQSLWNILTGNQQPVTLNLEGFKLSLTMPASFNPSTKPDLGKLVNQIQQFRLAQPTYPTIIRVKQGTIELRDRNKKVLAVWAPVDLIYEFKNDPLGSHAVSLAVGESADRPETLRLDAKWAQQAGVPLREELTFSLGGDDVSLQNLRPLYATALGENTDLGNLFLRSSGAFRRDQQSGWSLQLNAEVKNAQEIRTTQGGLQPVSFQLPAGHHLRLQLETAYEKAEDILHLPQVQLTAAETEIDVRGRIQQVQGPGLLELAGEVRIPGLSLQDLLPEALQRNLQVEGLQLSQMSLKGPLKPNADGTGGGFECGVVAGWQSVRGYGVTVEPGSVRCVLANQVLTSLPENVKINGGRLVRLPKLLVGGPSPVLEFEPGPMLEEVELTEEVCRDWLRYISPSMASATATQGKFTLSMTGGKFPLQQPEQADLSGAIRIHQATVRPGPMALEILNVVNQVRSLANPAAPPAAVNQTLMRIAEEDVRFRVAQSRVYHDQFRFTIGEAPVVTTGSVGFDNTLDMRLGVGLPDQWFENRGPVLQAMKGEVIQLAVAGNTDRPRIDASPLADFGKRIGVRAGFNLLERIIDKRNER